MSESPPADPDRLLEHVQWVRSLAFHLVHDDARADDLTQETLLAALEAPPKGNVRAWMAKVLRYRRSTQHRADSRRLRREQTAATPESLPSTSDVMERAELQRNLVEAVFSLRDPFRTTIVLRYFEGLDSDAIARQQRVSPATVRSRLKRGRDLLREKLDADFGDRRTWSLAMLPLFTSRPDSITTAAASAAGSSTLTGALAGGVILMSAKTMTAAAVAAIVIACGAMMFYSLEDTGTNSHEKPSAGPVAQSGEVDAPSSPVAADEAPSSPNDLAAAEAEEAPAPTITEETALGSIRGTISDETGAPISEVVLHAVKLTNDLPDMELPFQIEIPIDPPDLSDPENRAETDSAGEYEITGLAPGKYSVVARGSGFRQHVQPRVEVEEKQPADVSFMLAEGFSIEGLVLDPSGRPVPDAKVTSSAGGLFLGDMGISLSLGGSGSKTGAVETTTDSRGRFRLEGLGSGNQNLTAVHKDWAPGSQKDVASGSKDVEITLPRGGSIAGRVIGPNGEPIKGAEVSPFRFLRASTTPSITDAEGRFLLSGLRAGRRPLTAQADGFPSVTERFMVVAGEAVEVEIVLEAGVQVTGVIVDPDGATVAGASVSFTPAGHGLAHMALPNPLTGGSNAETKTDEEGRFQVSGLKADTEYEGHVEHPRFMNTTIESFISEQNLDLGTVVLDVGAELRGRVTNSDGEPVVGAKVALVDAEMDPGMRMIFNLGGAAAGGSTDSDTTTEDGFFTISGVASGAYELSVKATGYGPYRGESFDVSESQQLDALDVVLDRGLEVSGRVADVAGNPVAGAKITVSRFRPEMTRSETTSKADGSFLIRGLAEGQYSVRATADGFSNVSQSRIEAGTRDLQLVFQRKGSVSGVVVDVATGNPVEEFSISVKAKRRSFDFGSMDLSSLANLAGSGEEHRFKDPAGEFRIADLNPGKHTLIVQARRFVTHEEDIEIPEGAELGVTLTLDRGGAIEGRVVDRKGAPVVGATIEQVVEGKKNRISRSVGVSIAVNAEDGEGMTSFSMGGGDDDVKTDADGYFLYPGLAPGELEFKVQHRDYLEQTIDKVLIVKGETREVPLVKMERGASIRGTVFGRDGQTTNQATLMFYRLDEDGNRKRPVFTTVDSDGGFVQSGLEGGTYEVEVRAWDQMNEEDRESTGPTVVEVEPGQEVRQDMRLQ